MILRSIEYLRKRTQAEEIEAYFSGYEHAPLTADEASLLRWNAERFAEVVDEPAAVPTLPSTDPNSG